MSITRSDDQSKRLGAMLGEAIARRRKSFGWTQAELAEKIGVDTETVSRIERGSNLPSLARLSKISVELDVSLGQLVGMASERKDDFAILLGEKFAMLSPEERQFAFRMLNDLCDFLIEEKLPPR